MIVFSKPDGKTFDLEYEGAIHAFDSGGDLIAICRGKETLDIEMCDCEDECFCEPLEIIGDPRCWSDWEITISVIDPIFLMQAIASAYAACSVCEKMMLALCSNGEEEA